MTLAASALVQDTRYVAVDAVYSYGRALLTTLLQLTLNNAMLTQQHIHELFTAERTLLINTRALSGRKLYGELVTRNNID